MDAAARLSRREGLEAWSTRQLLAEVPTSFSVIYRLVGDREALSAAVVDQAVTTLSCPDPELPWRDWMTEMLLDLRKLCLEYPGMANWVLTRGGTVPAVLPILAAGLGVMKRAGFGDEVALAYTFVFTSVVTLISMQDQRRPQSDDSPSPLGFEAMRERLEALPNSELLAVEMASFVGKLADDTDAGLQASYEYALARALDGVEQRLG